MISKYLHDAGDRTLHILRSRITTVFCCSLKFCAIAIEKRDGRFKKGIKLAFNEDIELSKLLSEMRSAKNQVDRCIDTANYREIKRAGRSIEAIDKSFSREERNEILEWLSPLDFETRHGELLERVKGRPNAGKKLLDSKTFQNWTKTRSSKLWYTGKPGAGKSVLASIIIRHLQNVATKDKSEPVVAFLYMSHKRETTVRDLLGSVVRQIVAEMPLIPSIIEEAWKAQTSRGKYNGQYPKLSEEILTNFLSNLLSNRPFYIILDAMDECALRIRKPLLDSLKKINEDVRILVTARLLEKRDELSEGFSLEVIKALKSDIDEYIDSEIDNDSTLQKGSREVIKSKVRRKSGEMFLLVKLHMAALSNLDDPEQIWEILENLPETVDESYANAIDRVKTKDKERRDLARATLAWMSYALQPLKFQELTHAIATQMNKEVIKNENPFSKERITSVCCGLVEIDMDDVVLFVHYSAQTYFQGRKELEFNDFCVEIPLACAKYLCMRASESPAEFCHSEESLSRSEDGELDTSPFAEYAAKFLNQHFKVVRKPESTTKYKDLERYLRKLVKDAPNRTHYSNLLLRSEAYYTHSSLLEGRSGYHGSEDVYSDIYDIAATPLHLAVFLGSSVIAQELAAEDRTNLDALDSFKQSPLMIAFKGGFGDIADMLVKDGATVDLSCKTGHVFLLYAIQRGYRKVADKILANVKQPEIHWSLFDLGSLIFTLLISPFLILLYFVNKRSEEPTSSIQSACEGDTGTWKNSEANPLLHQYGQLLVLAYEGRSNEVENFILSHPLDSEEPSDSPICTRRYSWSSSDSDISIDKKETLQAQDFFNTACFLAVECGHTKTVEVLLNNVVDAKSRNFSGQPLLHRAVFRNKKDLVKVILDKAPFVDVEDDNRRTAFTAHAGTEHEEILNYLISQGANINHTNFQRVHELYRAAAFGNTKMVNFFLDVGVSASITNQFSWTPLHEASANGHLECVKLLLQKKAKLSPISDVGKTPLDLVNSGELHYDWPCLGEDSEHYLNGEVYKKRELELGDIERKNEIKELLLKHGAKTAEELYNEDKSAFTHVRAGPFSHDSDYSDSDDIQDTNEDSDVEESGDSEDPE
ncbi:hypothetical protein OCU04_010671 [Sclerotinia nivalis]|uniref:NACHT domain-containing protein n=1 Tax=Sclerotinia nivalis TaxID=352851 RepID=A0A9X0ADS9_9HELO|nr:hypothetical protein OCU04_010671 [Sclerotinia nivalis]